MVLGGVASSNKEENEQCLEKETKLLFIDLLQKGCCSEHMALRRDKSLLLIFFHMGRNKDKGMRKMN